MREPGDFAITRLSKASSLKGRNGPVKILPNPTTEDDDQVIDNIRRCQCGTPIDPETKQRYKEHLCPECHKIADQDPWFRESGDWR